MTLFDVAILARLSGVAALEDIVRSVHSQLATIQSQSADQAPILYDDFQVLVARLQSCLLAIPARWTGPVRSALVDQLAAIGEYLVSQAAASSKLAPSEKSLSIYLALTALCARIPGYPRTLCDEVARLLATVFHT